MEQLSFFNDPPPSAAQRAQVPFYQRDVVFFGIRLSELGPEVADVQRMLKRSHSLTGVPYQPDRLHVSLLRVGERDTLTEADLEQLRGAASRVSFSSFPVVFETVLSYDGNAGADEKRPVVFPVTDGAAEIIALARDIEAALHRRLQIEGGSVASHDPRSRSGPDSSHGTRSPFRHPRHRFRTDLE